MPILIFSPVKIIMRDPININYWILVQVNQQYSSSMENLLSERDSSFAGGEGGSPRGGHVGLVKYGSTGSISSIGSNNHFDSQVHGSRPATYTPSSLYR